MILPLIALATAAEPALDAPLIELIPVGEIVADGQTPVILRALILDERAEPYEGLELKLGVDRRPVDDLEALGGGSYQVSWVPPLATSGRDVAVEIRAKTPARERLRRSWTVPLRPPPPGALSVSATPERLIAGDGGADLELALSGTAQVAEGARLLLASSAGELGAVRDEGAGRYAARLTIGDAEQPRCVIVGAVDARDPAASAGLLVLPQASRRSVRLSGEPGSQVMIGLGDWERGPYPVDSYGALTVALDLPPGVSEAAVVSLSEGRRSESLQALPVRPTRRVQLFPLPAELPAEPGERILIRAAVVRPDCRPDVGAAPRFTASAGSLGPPRHEGGGIYVADYTPPPEPGPLAVGVALDDGEDPQRDSLELELIDPLEGAGQNPVHTLLLLPAEQRLPPNGLSGVSLTALALDAYGLPVSGVPLTLTVIQGDGELPGAATTDARGRAELYYTAGRRPGLVNLMVTDGARVANAALLQLGDDVAPELQLPGAGDPERRALTARWSAALSAP